jgi:hypothetical protein
MLQAGYNNNYQIGKTLTSRDCDRDDSRSNHFWTSAWQRPPLLGDCGRPVGRVLVVETRESDGQDLRRSGKNAAFERARTRTAPPVSPSTNPIVHETLVANRRKVEITF